MSYSNSDSEKKGIPLPAIIAAVVAAIAAAGYMGYRSFGPAPVAPLTAAEQGNNKIVEEIVKRSGGDMSKITPEDQAALQKIAGAYGAQAYNDVKKKMGM